MGPPKVSATCTLLLLLGAQTHGLITSESFVVKLNLQRRQRRYERLPSLKSARVDPEKKIRQRPRHVYKHLYRHYDDVSFDSWLRCDEPFDFLVSVGYKPSEVEDLANSCPKILTQNVHSTLAPKIRFLVETLGGGTGALTWASEEAAMQALDYFDDEEEECPTFKPFEQSPHSMRVSKQAKHSVPPGFYSCNLDRTLGPRHAYLMHHNLPHGSQLLENPKLLEDLLEMCDTKAPKENFADMCSRWEALKSNNPKVHTTEDIEIFEGAFCPGLVPAAKQANPFLEKANCTPDKAIHLLISNGANHLETDCYGVKPLYWAAGSGMIKGVRALLEAHLRARADGFCQDNYADFLIYEQSAKGGATPFHWACCGVSTKGGIGFGGSLDVCKLFLDKVGTRKLEIVNAKTWSQSTPLMWASWASSNLAVVEFLVKEGADLHATGNDGTTAAHWAAAGGQLDVCQYLKGQGVDFTLEDDNGKSPLDYAKTYDRRDIVDWIEAEAL